MFQPPVERLEFTDLLRDLVLSEQVCHGHLLLVSSSVPRPSAGTLLDFAAMQSRVGSEHSAAWLIALGTVKPSDSA
jgi:hypothetical protein